MNNFAILERVADVARSTFRVSVANLTMDTTADDIDGWDSLSHAVFLMNIEQAFAIHFNPNDVVDLENVGSLVSLIQALKG